MKLVLNLGLLAALVLAIRPVNAAAQAPAAAVAGTPHTYKVKLGKKDAGWERFQITSQGSATQAQSTGEFETGGVKYTIETSAEVNNGLPAHYSITVKTGPAPRKYTVDFKDGKAVCKIEAGNRSTTRKTSVHSDAVLLDRNVWYQYQLLISRYDMSKAGVQNFHAFAAHPALLEYPVEVEFQGEKKYKYHGDKIDARVFGVQLGVGFQLLITVDPSGVPLEIEIPAQDEKITLDE